jgi:two-component system phosphate regulon sensor histidine kinase PhoR
MLIRVLSLLLPMAAGGVVGGLAGHWPGALAGVILVATVLGVVEFLRLHRLQEWLRRLQMAHLEERPDAVVDFEPPSGRIWGETVDRVRRLLKMHIRAQQDSERRLQEMLSAIQASPNGVVLLDADGRIEWCNQTATQHLGLDASRDLQQYVANLIRDPDFNAYIAGGQFGGEVIVSGRASTPARPVRLSLQVHPYGKGQRLLLSRDVTLIEQAEVMRRDFVANVSHEMRTPLTVLAGFVETMQTLELPPQDVRRYLDLMAVQSQRMQTLVNDLLTLSRLEGSPPPGMGDWVGIDVFMAQCEVDARALSSYMGRVEHQIEFDQQGAVQLCGAASELQSAFSNLVSNAVRYTPAPGRVSVSWRLLPDGRGEFAVQDSGPGIAAEHLPRLTERFYRVDRSRSRESGGTGLGLAIVKHVVQRHGASLHIDSELGRGSRFAIVLPSSRVRQETESSAALKAA